MTEYLTIYREWTNDNYYSKRFSLEELLNIMDTLGMEGDEFTEFITGLTEDGYAEGGSEQLKDMYDDLSHNDEEEYKVKNAIIRCMKTEEFLTCYTVFRLWNTNLTQEEAEKEWFSSCYQTLCGLVEP